MAEKEWPKRACAYARVSTKKQEEGLDSQIFSIGKLIKEKEIELLSPPFAEGALWEEHPIPEKEWGKAQDYPDYWCDFGVSGATMSRPMFQAMILEISCFFLTLVSAIGMADSKASVYG